MAILCYISNIKLQMDRMGTGYVLEGRDQDRKLRINLLYHNMGGVGGVSKRIKVVLINFSGYLGAVLISSKIQLLRLHSPLEQHRDLFSFAAL